MKTKGISLVDKGWRASGLCSEGHSLTTIEEQEAKSKGTLGHGRAWDWLPAGLAASAEAAFSVAWGCLSEAS